MHVSLIRHYFNICLTLILSKNILAQNKVHIDWSVYSELPGEVPNVKHPGLAGAFNGIINDFLIIIGGANFPDKMPWEGGIKKYHDDVYILKLSDEKADQWNKTIIKFPLPIAYGVSVVYQDKLICIGGENENGPTDQIWVVSLNPAGDDLATKELAKLPVRLTNHAATIVGHTLFVAGGETKTDLSNNLYSLDLNNSEKGFKTLSKIPNEVSHTLLLPSSLNRGAHLYLIGGRRKNINGISTLYSSVYKYDIKKDAWSAMADLPNALSALSGVTISKNQILIMGGDKGDTFSKTENLLAAIQSETNPNRRQELVILKNQLQLNHPGFSEEILYFDVKKNQYFKSGIIPFDTPVTTAALLWNKSIIIPSGEIKAGVRSPYILMGKIKQK